MILFHVTTLAHFESQKGNDCYESPTFEEEKFIHLSTNLQVEGVLNRYYSSERQLILFLIDSEKLGSALVSKALVGDELFPHLYSSLSFKTVLEIRTIIRTNENWDVTLKSVIWSPNLFNSHET